MNESDMEGLSLLSTITTFVMSLAGMALGWILNIWWDQAIADQAGSPSPIQTLGDPVVKMLWGVVAVCLIVAGVSCWRTKNKLSRIKAHSQVITQ